MSDHEHERAAMSLLTAGSTRKTAFRDWTATTAARFVDARSSQHLLLTAASRVSLGLLMAISAPLSAQSGNSADVAFMQGMIAHHQQALDMAALVPARTTNADIKTIAQRITVSQTDEIKTMRTWLTAHHQPAMDSMPMMMPGMLAPDQMKKLSAARGVEFDQLFLTGMIQHHAGALRMVADLFEHKGAGQESQVFRFASDVDSDQRDEIARMQALLNTRPNP